MATVALAALTFAATPARAAATPPSEQLRASPFSAPAPGAGALDAAPAPAVTLEVLPLRSRQRSPSFSGSASETTPVTIEVFSGEGAQGELFLFIELPIT